MPHHLNALLFLSLLLVSVSSYPLGDSFDQNCGRNSMWTPHGTDCPANCANRVPKLCNKMFVPSCQCLRGFVFRAGKSGDCIRREDCPSTVPLLGDVLKLPVANF